MAATHFLESQGQALSEVLNATYHGSHSPTEETKTGVVSRVEMQLIKEATDFLESREQALSRTQMQLTLQAAHKLNRQGGALSAWSKCSSPQKPLTGWRDKDKHC